ncbi:MAG TPA: hypothetical protein VGH28_04005 [Polyangiaceae bacterium]|jgi:hypothetical protein
MRPRAFALALAGTGMLAAAAACVDLFHSTSGVLGICERDASDPRCSPDASEAGPPELCAGDAAAAQSTAMQACALLAACDHPIGQNKTGACMVDAILAYDCEANPNRKVKGAAAQFWECMQTAKTCGDVGKCVFPDGVPGCTAGGFLGCSQSTDNVDSRIDCVQATPGGQGENCAAYGQTCNSLDPDAANLKAVCINPGGQGRACVSATCSQGHYVSLCDDGGVDRGYDCADFGAGTCSFTGASPACKPESTGTCAATNDVTCSPTNVIAQGCVTGAPETIDCTAISGPGTCVPIEAGAPGVVPADACQVADGGCTDDTCSGAALIACVRGRSVPIDCSKYGLKPCNTITTNEGSIVACSPP